MAKVKMVGLLSRMLCLAILLLWQGLLGTTSIAQSPNRWPFELSVGQFAIHSDFDVVTESKVLDQLRPLQADIEQTLQIAVHSETVHLILFDRQANYQGYLQQYFPSVPFRRALFIKRRGPGMVFAYKSAEMHVDLRHETTHALLNASLPYVPLWLDEGLAEYFENAAVGNRRDHDHAAAIRRKAFWRQVPSVHSLEAIDDLSGMGATEYQEAWSWVHFLLHESPESKAVLVRFLQDLQAHSPPGQLSRRIADAIPDWKRRYIAHFRR